jgi:hypothetical protein
MQDIWYFVADKAAAGNDGQARFPSPPQKQCVVLDSMGDGGGGGGYSSAP